MIVCTYKKKIETLLKKWVNLSGAFRKAFPFAERNVEKRKRGGKGRRGAGIEEREAAKFQYLPPSHPEVTAKPRKRGGGAGKL